MTLAPLVDHLKLKMKEAGENSSSLALKAGLSRTAVRDIIAGKSKSPTIATLESIAAALGCEASDLLTGSEQPARDTNNTLAQARKAAGLTQQQLAEKVGSHWITISKLERGQIRLTTDWITKLSATIGCEASAIWAMAEPSAAPHPERIVAAAIQFGATISLPPPARHHTIIQTMDAEMGISGVLATPQTQGFITDTGRYVNRVEAYYIAWKARQIISGTKGPQLFSEDLW